MDEQNGEQTYEMLWDCAYCGASKLLGVTQRYCPECGAAQDPDKRYFPADDDKVTLEDHRYVGADRMCPYCNEAQSAAAKHCTACGGDFEGAKQASLKQEQLLGPSGEPAQAHAAAPASKASGEAPKQASNSGPSRLAMVLGLLALVLISLVLVNTFWTKEAKVEVSGLSWTRSIAIESYREFEDKGPCNKVPAGAKVLSRKKGKKVCKKRRVDQGDGSFKEKKECTKPKEVCTYRARAWKKVRSVKQTGGVGDAPAWPATNIRRHGQCKGCERPGAKTEVYRVKFKDTKSKKVHGCTFDQNKWKSFKVGTQYNAKLGGLSGGLRCSALSAK